VNADSAPVQAGEVKIANAGKVKKGTEAASAGKVKEGTEVADSEDWLKEGDQSGCNVY
jgi:hypothetical protein